MRVRKSLSLRLLSILLVLSMAVGLMPATVFAAQETGTDATAANVAKIESYAAQMREDNTKSDYTAGKFTWDTENKTDSWRYFNGVMLDAFMMVGGSAMTSYVDDILSANVDSDGTCANYHAGELDSVPMALAMFDLLDSSENAAKYKLAIQFIYSELEKQVTYDACGGNYLHKQDTSGNPTSGWTTWNIGLDGLYMAEPFLMECANAIDANKLTLTDKDGKAVQSSAIYEAVYNRFAWVADTMYDSTTGLYNHGWSVDNTKANGHFWGRGIGWYAVALVDVIAMMPTSYQNQMIPYLTKLFDGMLTYQDAETGMWYNVVNRDSTLVSSTKTNILETSVSSMMAYALMKAYNLGFVTDATYGKAGLAAFNGVVANKVTGSEGSYAVKDTYLKSGVGETDVYYLANSYTVDEAKGTGALIMAATQANAAAAKLNGTTEPEEPAVSESLTDKTTGVTVSGSGATAIAVEDKSTDTTVSTALAGLLESGFRAYDITLTGYTQGTSATVTLPAPDGANKVYYVPETGTPEEIADATFENNTVTFTTTHFSTYAVGKAADSGSEETTDKNWISLQDTVATDDTYTQVTSMDSSNQDGYLISRTSSTYYLLAYSSDTAVTRQSTERSGSSTAYTFTNTSEKTWWYIDASGHIYCTVNGTNYYLKATYSSGSYRLELVTAASSASKWTVTKSSNNVKISTTANSKTVYLRYSSNSFSTSTSNNTVALYQRTPGTPASSGGQAALAGTLSYNVTVGSTLTEDAIKQAATIYYRASETATEEATVAWADSNVTTSWDKALDNKTAGTYTMTVKYKDTELGTIVVTVSEKTITKSEVTGGPITAAINGTPDYSGVSCTITFDDGTTETVSSDKLTFDTCDTSTLGTKTVKVSYNGAEVGTVEVIVSGDPFAGLEDATEYPEYPADGAVRIDKTATGQDFNSTGVVKVELDAAGISVKQGVDVVLVVDVSNSMAWSLENAADDGTGDAAKLPSDGQTTKLDHAMSAATSFAQILLGENTGAGSDNSISFVTFAGYDSEHYNTASGKNDNLNYVDSVMTVFTNVKDYDKAATSFAGTSVTGTANGTGATYTLKVTDENGSTVVNGGNRGNTNYDYAFYQAQQAVTALQSQYTDYASSGRTTYIVFMTDGAPSHYNQQNCNGGSGRDYWPDSTTSTYSSSYTTSNWSEYLLNTDNMYANTLYQMVGGNFYALGFDLANGGFSDYEGNEETLTKVLAGMVTDATIPVMATDDAATLNSFYKNLATQIKYAGTNAKVTDTIGSNFTLQTTSFGTNSTPLTITVTAYDLYTKANATDTSLIGTRTGTSSTLETVTFNENGTEAYSNLIGDGKTNIMTTADGVTTIAAQYFTYTKDAEGVETFAWNIGNITDKEVALSYYAYLKGSMEGMCEKGVYYTNESATIEYVDINNKHATQEFPVPGVAWGGASTSFEYYLVNYKGEPVNRAGEVVPFANRIVLYGDTVVLNLNQDLTIPAQNINASDYLPEGYFLYDVNAFYTVQTSSNGGGGITVSKPSDDAKKSYGDITQTGAQTTVVVSHTAGYIQSRVAFGVSWENTPVYMDYKLVKDQTVMDYGKAIQVDVLSNDITIPSDCIGTLVGFTDYNARANLKQAQQSVGSPEYTTANGTYTINSGKVNFQPKAMLSAVEKVFCVIKITKNDDNTNYYYLYEELDIIPATIMYYETDFADGVFTLENGTTNVWNKEGTAETETQDPGTISSNTYGYDSSYADDSRLSNSSSWKVTGEKNESNKITTTASFSFTGTGFDIISRTGANQGLIQVKIYAQGTTEPTKTVKVLNKGENELYQIPVVSVNGLAYGTYTVTIEVCDAVTYTGTLESLSRGGEFYFDALRVYDPIDASGTTGDAAIALDAYQADGEAYNDIIEVRKLIIDAETYNDMDDTADGVIFVDSNASGVVVSYYETIGPNNEVYLSEGQGIAFKLTCAGVPTSIDIGAKSADGKAITLSAGLYDSDGTALNTISREIKSCTALFYDLRGDKSINGEVYVVIKNASTADDSGILSITDLKVAYNSAPASTASLSVNTYTLAVAARAFSLEEEEPNYDILEASFDSDTCKLRKNATMTVVTTDDVKSLLVTDKKGKAVKANITSTTENGQTTWTVSIRMTVVGRQTYTVTGYSADGTAGAPASATINVTRK